MAAARRWWVGSSLVGLVVSAALLALALRDEALRERTGTNGAMGIFTRATVVLKSQLCAYFALCLLAATSTGQNSRLVSLVLGNLVLTWAALHRLRVRGHMVRWAKRRDRRSSDRRKPAEVISHDRPPRDLRNHLS